MNTHLQSAQTMAAQKRARKQALKVALDEAFKLAGAIYDHPTDATADLIDALYDLPLDLFRADDPASALEKTTQPARWKT